jgi:hypothetical protein
MRDQRPTSSERDEAASFGALQRALNHVYDDFSWIDLCDTAENGMEALSLPRLAAPTAGRPRKPLMIVPFH